MLLYFLENRNSNLSLSDVQAMGLGYAFTRNPRGRHAMRGPNETGGWVFAECDNASRVLFKGQDQTWHPYPGIEGLWFGWWTDDLPTPAVLLKPEFVPGHDVNVNGQLWHVPKALHVANDTSDDAPRLLSSLPSTAATDGKSITGPGKIIARFERLWKISEIIWQVFEQLQDSNSGSLPENAMELAAEVLSINYRLSLPEICALELIRFNDPDHTWSILRCVIDVPTINEWNKKKDAQLATAENASSLPPVA